VDRAGRAGMAGKIQNPKFKIQGNFKLQPSNPRMGNDLQECGYSVADFRKSR
jgi:hypothetical protein